MGNIAFKPSDRLAKLAEFTLQNMTSYYERYSVEWDAEQIVEQTKHLNNYEILCDAEVIGVMRLEYFKDSCWLRDLQIAPKFQNQGIGQKALNEAKRKALSSNFTSLSLKVFRISPALTLYKRNNFLITHEDERFYYMELKLE
jgi:GNAT superfamily N-acetyltransferase